MTQWRARRALEAVKLMDIGKSGRQRLSSGNVFPLACPKFAATRRSLLICLYLMDSIGLGGARLALGAARQFNGVRDAASVGAFFQLRCQPSTN